MCQYKSLCKPLKELIALLKSYGFVIDKQELKDWHFNEFEIVMIGLQSQLPTKVEIEDIKQHNDNTYFCKCHWSVIRLIFKDNILTQQKS